MLFKNSNIRLAFKNIFLPKLKYLIVLEPHMGLGDALINLGLIKTIAKQNPKSIFFYACLQSNYHSIMWMLKELNNVFPLVVSSGREARQYASFKNAIYLPIGVIDVDIKKFDQSFYAQHKVPFYLRWELCKTSAGIRSKELFEKLNPQNLPFMLICNKDSSQHVYDLKITNRFNLLTINVSPITTNIYDWTDLVLEASEIHTIDTAFIHFVENTLNSETKQKLFFHKIRKSTTDFTRRLFWQDIFY